MLRTDWHHQSEAKLTAWGITSATPLQVRQAKVGEVEAIQFGMQIRNEGRLQARFGETSTQPEELTALVRMSASGVLFATESIT